MFLLFPKTLLEEVVPVIQAGNLLVEQVPPGRFGSSRPSLRRTTVSE
jgi:hypothetical protein